MTLQSHKSNLLGSEFQVFKQGSLSRSERKGYVSKQIVSDPWLYEISTSVWSY